MNTKSSTTKLTERDYNNVSNGNNRIMRINNFLSKLAIVILASCFPILFSIRNSFGSDFVTESSEAKNPSSDTEV
jgi:hypothetical protein